MPVTKQRIPKLIKFNYRNRERLWLRVEKIEGNYYYGYVDNKPITSKTLKYNDCIKVNKNNVVDKKG